MREKVRAFMEQYHMVTAGERVLRLGGCRARDDMTVLVARIWKK